MCTVQQNRSAGLGYSMTRADRAVLTNEDFEKLQVCAQPGDCLAAANALVILLIGCATGFDATYVREQEHCQLCISWN